MGLQIRSGGYGILDVVFLPDGKKGVGGRRWWYHLRLYGRRRNVAKRQSGRRFAFQFVQDQVLRKQRVRAWVQRRSPEIFQGVVEHISKLRLPRSGRGPRHSGKSSVEVGAYCRSTATNPVSELASLEALKCVRLLQIR